MLKTRARTLNLEDRITALEERINSLEQLLKKQLDLFRALQIEDEAEIRRLYDEIAKVKSNLTQLAKGL